MKDREVLATTWEALGSHLASVFHSISSPLAALSLDHRFIEVNQAYTDMIGRSRGELVGRFVFEAFPENPGLVVEAPASGLVASLEKVAATGLTERMPVLRFDIANEAGDVDERFFNVSNIPIFDDDGTVAMVLVHAEEVTAFMNKRMKNEVSAPTGLPSQATAMEGVFTAELSRLESLNDFSTALVAASTPDEVGRAVCRDGLKLAGAVAGSLMLLNSEQYSMVTTRGVDSRTAVRWEQFYVDVGNEPFSDAITTGEPLFFNSPHDLLASYPSLADEVSQNPGHQAWVVLPLQFGEQRTGAIGLIYDRPQEFSAALRLLLYSLASLTGQAASRAQLLEEQKDAVESVQDALRPRIDPIPGVTISHLYRPATVATEAGGDWYDVINLSASKSLLVIGDVANHGTAAIGEMSRVRATVHSFAVAVIDPCDIAAWTDELLAKLATTHTTCIVGILDHDTRVLTWTTAGHPYPVIVDSTGTITVLDETHGAPLGTGFTSKYGQQQRHLDTGDTIVLYTDGLIERRGEPLDEATDQLCAAIKQAADSDDVAGAVFAEMVPNEHRDDIAVLVLRFDR